MKRLVTILTACIILTACASTQEQKFSVGASEAELVASCHSVVNVLPTPSFANGEKAVYCGQVFCPWCTYAGDEFFRTYFQEALLISNGKYFRKISRDEVIARLEHEECLSYGLKVGTTDYTNCRLTLAQIRTQKEAAAAQLRANMQAQQSASMMMLGLGLLNASHPRYVPSSTVRLQTNCISQQIGGMTHYQCH